MMFEKAKVDALRKQYPPGTRIKLEHMDDPRPIEPGTGGTVRFIDDARQVGVEWDNGRSLSVIPGVDSFSIQHLQNLNFYMPMTVNVERLTNGAVTQTRNRSSLPIRKLSAMQT